MAQTFNDFELLILDNGSKPYISEIIKSYSDNRIKFFRVDENIGPARGRNFLLEYASGEFIAPMDSDDVSLPQRFMKQLDFMDKHPNVGVLGTGTKISKKNCFRQTPLDDNSIKYALLYDGCAFFHSSVMLRASVLRENNLCYNENFSMAEDYALWLDLLLVTDMACLPDLLTVYRFHDENSSIANELQQKNYGIILQFNAIEKFNNIKIKDKQTLIDFYTAPTANKIMLKEVLIALKNNSDITCFNEIHNLFRNKMRTLFYHMHGVRNQWMLMTSKLSGYLRLGMLWRIFVFITRGIF